MADTYWDLFYAYSALWILVSAYLIFIGREQRKLLKRAQMLEEQLKTHEKA